jgi:hypothetical protein
MSRELRNRLNAILEARKRFPYKIGHVRDYGFIVSKYQNLICETYVNAIEDILNVADEVMNMHIQQIKFTRITSSSIRNYLLLYFSFENWGENDPDSKEKPLFYKADAICSSSAVIKSIDDQMSIIKKINELKIADYSLFNLREYFESNEFTKENFQVADRSENSFTLIRKSKDNLKDSNNPENLKERYLENRTKIVESYLNDIIEIYEFAHQIENTDFLLTQLWFSRYSYDDCVNLNISFDTEPYPVGKVYAPERAFSNMVTGTTDSKRDLIEKLTHLNIPSCILSDLVKYLKNELRDSFEIDVDLAYFKNDNANAVSSLRIKLKDI